MKTTTMSNKHLPPGYALPRLKSFFIEQATRGAGKTLYEILGMAELMRVAYEKGDLESLQQRLSLLLSEAAGLSVTLSSIIELARVGTDDAEPVFREFDIIALLRRVVRAASALVGEKPVTVMDVASPGPLVVMSDPRKIRQIMAGLTHNAAKYTDRGRIALIVNKEQDSLRLMVTDTGRGMSPEEISTYFQADDHEFDGRPEEGSRLGIRMVKNLVRSLDGTISVSSKVGEGTIVEVALPLIDSSRHRSPSGSRQAVQAQGDTFRKVARHAAVSDL